MTSHNHPSSPTDRAEESLRREIERLSEQDIVLIMCTYELYDGDWGLLRQDLIDRLEGRAFVVKLGKRIEDDLQRADRLQAIEQQFGIKLVDFVSL